MIWLHGHRRTITFSPHRKMTCHIPWNEQSFNTKPMVQWRFSGFENCYSTSEYRMHALCASDHSLDIPFGWRRRTDGSFQHDSDHTTLFRYPVPTINFLTTSPSSFIISGKVFRSYFTFNVAYWESLFGYRGNEMRRGILLALFGLTFGFQTKTSIIRIVS